MNGRKILLILLGLCTVTGILYIGFYVPSKHSPTPNITSRLRAEGIAHAVIAYKQMRGEFPPLDGRLSKALFDKGKGEIAALEKSGLDVDNDGWLLDGSGYRFAVLAAGDEVSVFDFRGNLLAKEHFPKEDR